MRITMMGGLFGNITSDVQNLVPRASREESRTLHAFEYLVSRVIIEYVTWWNSVKLWLCELCEDVYMLIFDILVMLVYLVILIDDVYFGDSNKCELHVYDLVISLVSMTSLPKLLKWRSLVVKSIRQGFRWHIWLVWMRSFVCIRIVCTLCKMNRVACRIIIPKWWDWCSLIIRLYKDWGEKFLYWLVC